MTQRVFVIGAGAVSAYGPGRAAMRTGLFNGTSALVARDYPGAGTLRVGACDHVESVHGEDRAITLLHSALDELSGPIGRLQEVVPPERRGACCATSKGALMLYLEDPARAPERLLDLLPDAPARWLARKLDARGPVQALVGACATGLHNICRGAGWIASGYADFVVAGSSEATLTPMYLASFVNLGAMSREGCRPFDRQHNGFVAGEGAGLVILATESAAARAGLRPVAEITGWRSEAEAFHQTSTRADGAHLAGLLGRTLKVAGCDAGEIDLLAAHGTGTVANDRAEGAGLNTVYRDRHMPPVFSTKGAIGHIMGGTGSVEFAACLECLEGGFIPATVGFNEHAPECVGLDVRTKSKPMDIRRILKWNLGFGGHLIACVLEKR